ncbi:COG complex component, COG2 domain-containing protein [Rozella allomycis CSF55]|uniref:COG complex component, COG2 domain-containing protein n=1 Tax=Rozella allomycis (strain CSF55) TaxID=988480 RepID=A0A075B1H1_ROZAC|nr:COG complex component, COG2 domain-containing protein [Rozella allomycis CSF55]|eukprot:EPZ36203.1 COG complex component, COG2 domain-containing protein [Rozella allomycis CSF55]
MDTLDYLKLYFNEIKEEKLLVKEQLFDTVLKEYPKLKRVVESVQVLKDHISFLKSKRLENISIIKPLYERLSEERQLLEQLRKQKMQIEKEKEKTVIMIKLEMLLNDIIVSSDINRIVTCMLQIKRILKQYNIETQSFDFKLKEAKEKTTKQLVVLFVKDPSSAIKYASLCDLMDCLYDRFRDYRFKPFIKKYLDVKKMDSNSLEILLQKIIEFLNENHFKEIQETISKVKNASFIVYSILPTLVSTLIQRHNSIFLPGIPSKFHQLINQFIDDLKRIAANEDELKLINESACLTDLLLKFNTGIYFQILYNDIVAELEEVFGMPSIPPPLEAYDIEQDERFHFSASTRYLSSLNKIWSDKYFIGRQKDMFWKLTMQDLKGNVALYFDAKSVPLLAQHIFEKDISGHLPMEHKEDFSVAFKNTIMLNVNVESKILECLLYSASQNIEQVKTLPNIYRGNNKAMPTESSDFLLSFFEPFLTFETTYKNVIQISSFALDYCRNLIPLYCEAIDKVLKSIKIAEESIRKLRKVKTTSFHSDEDKIKMQITLDIDHLIQLITAKLGDQGRSFDFNQLIELKNLITNNV